VREENDLTKFFQEPIVPQGSITFQALAEQVGQRIGKDFKLANMDALIKAHQASQNEQHPKGTALDKIKDQIKAREDDVANALNDNDTLKLISLTPRGHLPNQFKANPEVMEGINNIKQAGVTIVDEIDDVVLLETTFIRSAPESVGQQCCLKRFVCPS
jgi:hypothetical protein